MKNRSFVLMFTITILSLSTLLTHQLLRIVNVGANFDRTMVDRERAEMVALGGISLAMAQLSETKQKEFLEKVLPTLNRWQAFTLYEDIDGIDGEVKFCVSCENGKININEAFDFQKQQFKPTYKAMLENLKLKGPAQQEKQEGSFLKELTKFLKKRNRKLDEVTELISGIGKNVPQVFYEPPMREKKEKNAKPNVSLAIQDIFTIWTNSDKLEATLLSDALCAMLELKRPVAHDAQLQADVFKKVSKSFKPETDQNSEDYWKTIKPIYQPKNIGKLAKLGIFSSKFEPTTYSVLSSGKVGNVEQRVLAIIKKVSEEKQDEKKVEEKKEEDEKKDQKSSKFKIVRLYWI